MSHLGEECIFADDALLGLSHIQKKLWERKKPEGKVICVKKLWLEGNEDISKEIEKQKIGKN